MRAAIEAVNGHEDNDQKRHEKLEGTRVNSTIF